jgi:WD40 repeat protein
MVELMNTQRTIQVILLCILAISCIPVVRAVEPAWTYSTTNESVISTIGVSSDGSTIIVAADRLWIFSKDGTLLKKEQYGDNVVVTPSGRYAASSFGDTVYFFSTPLTAGPSDPKKLTKMWEHQFSDPVRSIDLTDDGSIVVVKTQGMGMFLIKTDTKDISSSAEFYNAVLRISHDGSRIVGISADTVHLYGRNAKVSKTFVMKNITSNNPDFVLLSQTVPLMVFNDGPKIRSYDLSMGTELWNARPGGTLNSLAMTPSGSFVVAGTENGDILRYDDSGNLNWSYASNNENSRIAGISEVVISKDGGLVATASDEGTILLLNKMGNPVGSYQVGEQIRTIAMSQDGSILLAAGDQNIYAFLTGYTASARSASPSAVKTPASGSLNTSGNNITSPQNLTRRPVLPTWTKPATSGTITELPTEYSIIRTPTKSPLELGTGILALIVCIIVYGVRRRWTRVSHSGSKKTAAK